MAAQGGRIGGSAGRLDPAATVADVPRCHVPVQQQPDGASGSDEYWRLDGLGGPRRWAQALSMGLLDFFLLYFILLIQTDIKPPRKRSH